MANSARGEVRETIKGREYVLVLNLGAIADLEDALNSSLAEIGARMSNKKFRVNDVMQTLAVMSQAGGNPITIDEMREWSLDDLKAISVAVGRALSAQFGDDAGNVDAGANPATSKRRGPNGSALASAS